eukprot:g32479.t1
MSVIPAPRPPQAQEDGMVSQPAQENKAAGELPGLEPTLKNIQPIPIKKTLVIVNHFILNTTEFINKFVSLCEQKLCKVSKKIQRLEIVLQLLEGRLQSIEWLNEGGNLITEAPAVPLDANARAVSTVMPPSAANPAAPPPPPGATPSGAPAAPPLKEHPLYRKYITLVMRGVPKAVLAMKMESEGLDPSVFDFHPNEPNPSSPYIILLDIESEGLDPSVLDLDPNEPTPAHLLVAMPPENAPNTQALVVAGDESEGEKSEESDRSEGMDDD